MYVFLALSDCVEYKKEFIFLYRNNSDSVCHRKWDARRLIFDGFVAAWDWAKNTLEGMNKQTPRVLKYIKQCDTMKKTYLSEFIQSACENGMPIKQIDAALAESGLMYLYDDASVWVDKNSKERWIAFQNTPVKLWIKYRIKGLASTVYRKLFKKSELYNVNYILWNCRNYMVQNNSCNK